jgi:hypothetical protein
LINMKLLGFVCNEESYKKDKEGNSPIILLFFRKCRLLKLIHSIKRVYMKILLNGLVGFQGFWSGGVKRGKNPLFQTTFGGILGFSEEEKGLQMENMEKIIYSSFCIIINPENFG